MNKAISIDDSTQQLLEVRVPTLKTVEIDFGLSAVRDKTFTVTDADVTLASLIMANHSAAAATGKSQDENEMDSLILKAVSGTGQFTLYATANPTLVAGAFNITYLVG